MDESNFPDPFLFFQMLLKIKFLTVFHFRESFISIYKHN